MKPLSIFLFLSVFALNSYAQRITYNDLNLLLKKNIGETEDYLSNKGLDFNKIDTVDAGLSIVRYNYAKYSGESFNYMSIDKVYSHGAPYEVSFSTNFQSDYLKIKSTLKLLGFTLKETDNYNGDLVVTYWKGVFQVIFMIHRNQEKEVTEYYITLENSVARWSAFHLNLKSN